MEWKILTETNSDVQKTLNQWKHQYNIHIHGVTTDANGKLVILLTRERKREYEE